MSLTKSLKKIPTPKILPLFFPEPVPLGGGEPQPNSPAAALQPRPSPAVARGGAAAAAAATAADSAPRHPRQFLPFGSALAVARSLGLASRAEWKAWCKKRTHPPNVPAEPSVFYKGAGWQAWGHWLGTGNTK